MKEAATVPLVRFSCLSLIAALSLLSPIHAQAQTLTPNSNQAQPIDPNDPSNLRPSGQSSGVLSMEGGKRLMSEAERAVSSQQYDTAVKKLQQARIVFNQLSNFYQELTASFSGIDNRIADTQRKKALESAQMRDQATYQLGLVHRAQNKPEEAVPLFVQIVKSQNPTRDLGKKAYQQLLELGFVDAPFPRGGNTSQK
jgi:tetratricopeptide (TPR) repeat protein